jgi:Fur family transcriptional regulator, ferric uptake regulator
VSEHTPWPEDASAVLVHAGLKATPWRVKVLQLFQARERRHWSAKDLHRQLRRSWGEARLATVYRVLNELTAAGILVRRLFQHETGNALYELDDGEKHHHFVCMDCGRVEEFVDDEIERLDQAVAAANGYALAARELILYGVCLVCPRAGESSE